MTQADLPRAQVDDMSTHDAARMRARLLGAVSATPAPTRSDGRRRATVLAVASLAVALAIFEGAGGLEHSASRPRNLTFEIAGGWALITALLSGAILWRSKSTLGRPPIVLSLGAFIVPVAVVVWMHLFQGTYPEPVFKAGWRCLGYTLAMSALPMASFLFLRRGIEPRGPWALGAAIGASCGASAGVLVDLWCPLTDPRHVLVGHVLPIVILVVLGTLLGRRVLGVRYSSGNQSRGSA
jgi:hypothetical protein